MQMQTAKAICSYSFKLIFPPTSRIENMVTSSSHYIVANALMVAIIGRHGRTHCEQKTVWQLCVAAAVKVVVQFFANIQPIFLGKNDVDDNEGKRI